MIMIVDDDIGDDIGGDDDDIGDDDDVGDDDDIGDDVGDVGFPNLCK